MEAKLVAEIPSGSEWQYEPKWDGFRCLAFKDQKQVYLQSKAGQPLARYFPEIVQAVQEIQAERCVLDGEIVIPMGRSLSFDALLMRVHPAASRIAKLAGETPGWYVIFDLLVDETGRSLITLPLAERRELLDHFAEPSFSNEKLKLSPFTRELSVARGWFGSAGPSLDGVMAKRCDFNYRSGDRTGMWKIKNIRSVDCVVGGFRYGSKTKVVGSLLLGLYDKEGVLHHVGFTSSMEAAEKKRLTKELEALVQAPGFTGRAPGGPSRWSTERSGEWQPLKPTLVVEIRYDHFTGGRFRHGTKLLRWRPDKSPRQCTFEQVEEGKGKGKALQLLGTKKTHAPKRRVSFE